MSYVLLRSLSELRGVANGVTRSCLEPDGKEHLHKGLPDIPELSAAG